MREERLLLEATLAKLTAQVQDVHRSQGEAEKRLSATESSAAEAASKFDRAQRDCQVSGQGRSIITVHYLRYTYWESKYGVI